MSTFEDERYQWRETYFILFDPSNRPLSDSIRKELEPMFSSLKIRFSQSDSKGRLETLGVVSFEDSAAIDIIFQSGEQVVAEMDALAKELTRLTTTQQTLEKIEKAKRCSARLDVLHFEQMLPVERDFIENQDFSLEISIFSENSFEQPTSEFPTAYHTDRENNDEKHEPNRDHNTKVSRDPFSRRSRFQFDPDQYIVPEQRPQFSFEENENVEIFDDLEEDLQENQLDPNALILVLEILCRLTDGVAIDPTSGTVL